MSRHFTPDKYQKSEERFWDKQNRLEAPDPKPPYEVYWWLKTKPWEHGDYFWIGFKKGFDTAAVIDSLAKKFEVHNPIRIICLYMLVEVQLGERVRWDRINRLVAEALEGLV